MNKQKLTPAMRRVLEAVHEAEGGGISMNYMEFIRGECLSVRALLKRGILKADVAWMLHVTPKGRKALEE